MLNYTIPKIDSFTEDEKLVIDIIAEFGLDKTKMLEKFSKEFGCSNITVAESLYLRIQKKILDKVSYRGLIDYPTVVNIANEIIKSSR